MPALTSDVFTLKRRFNRVLERVLGNFVTYRMKKYQTENFRLEGGRNSGLIKCESACRAIVTFHPKCAVDTDA